jgi:hypothetical protein
MVTTLRWMMMLTSLHGRTKPLECREVSLEAVLDDESALHNRFQEDPQSYETLKRLINPNEKPISEGYISMLEAYVDVVESLSRYMDSGDEQAGIKLENLSKDNSRFSGRFRGAIKHFMRYGLIDNPKIALKAYEPDGIDPLHRIVLRDYSDDVDEPRKADFLSTLKQVMYHDLVFRTRYHNAVVETDSFFADVLKRKDVPKTAFFQSSQKEYC